MKKLHTFFLFCFFCLTQSYGSNQPDETTNTAIPQQILQSQQNTNTTAAEVSLDNLKGCEDSCAKSYPSDNAKAQESSSLKNSKETMQNILESAKALNLAQHKEWKDLLHIDSSSSEIISPYFFLTPLPHKDKHKSLAESELEATLKAFYQPVESVEIPEVIIKRRQEQIQFFEENDIKLPVRSIQKQDYHALCRFPARLNFLKQHLDLQDLPQVQCEEFIAMRDYVAPTKASIVFPSAHINSPASMFGHTFLLLDSKFQSRLLSFAINYQADANQNEENGIVFGFKGLFGLYTGSYSILPYYDKIKEYSNTETRDIWEYELNLTPQEIAQLYNHIWELSDAFSPYYFFHRNCSYNVLWLLEVARPSLKLRHQFIYQVNPPETLFVLQKAHLITNQTYRPSKRTKLNAYGSLMSNKSVKLAKKLAFGEKQPDEITQDSKLSLQDKQYILESALELSEYHFIKGKLPHEQYTQIAHNLASTRSTLGSSTPPQIHTPKTNPLEGNQSLRITPLLLHNAQGFHPALDFRITYHDITDNDVGYLKGAQIELMRVLGYYDTSMQRAQGTNGAKIYEMNILSIASIAPMGKFFKPFSYRAETGFNRTFNDEDLHYFINFGGGMSYDFNNIAYAYYLLEPTFFLTHHNQPDFALNQVLGLVISDNNRLKGTFEYKFKAYTPKDFSHQLDSSLSFNLIQNLALFGRVSLIQNELHKTPQPTSMLGLRAYF